MRNLPMAIGLTVWLAACSPELNWRRIGFEGAAVTAQLPCKPDRTIRQVPLGGQPVDLHVAGCESGAAMVAVMTAALPPGADAQAALQGWQQATLANMQATAEHRQVWVRPGMLGLPAAQRISAQGQRADGQPVSVQAVWGALAEGDHVRLVHAAVYDRKINAELAEGVFEGLQP